MSAADKGIVIVGIGGAATRFVARAAELASGARAVCFDCDAASEALSGPAAFVLLGSARCDGHGTGGDAVKARAAALDDLVAVREAVAGARLAVVAVSLGGGFGSGAAPEILKALRDEGITAVCVATTPFAFEGGDRAAAARRAIPLVEGAAAATAVISLDDLFAGAGDAAIGAAFDAASATMTEILSLFWRLAARPGFISLGVERIASIASSSSGKLRVATARATGEGRAASAAATLLASPLPGSAARPENAEAVLVGVIAGSDLRLAELSEVSAALSARIPSTCRLDFGVIVDEALAGSLAIVGLLFEKGDAALAAPETGTAEAAPAAAAATPRSGRRGARKDPLAGSSSGNRFKGTEGTIYEGQNLDLPTYLRRNLPLEK